MGHPAGIAQLVEHDLAKVGVEGPSPFSRSKKRKSTTMWCFSFFLCVVWGRTLEEGAALFFLCTKCEKENNELTAKP